MVRDSGSVVVDVDDDFKNVIRIYATAFIVAHRSFPAAESAAEAFDESYQQVLYDCEQLIYDDTVEYIYQYLHTFEVGSEQSDWWKVVYFCGKAIYDNILATERLDSKIEIGRIHLTMMIGMLHLRLSQLGLDKTLLKEQLLRIARVDDLFGRLGDTGVYLCYKTLAKTAEEIYGPL